MRRAPRGRIRAFPPGPSRAGVEGAALPSGRGVWCVLPAGEGEFRVTLDRAALAVRWKRLGRREIELPVFPSGGEVGTAPMAASLDGSDLQRVHVIEVDALDAPPTWLRVEAGDGACLKLSLPARAPSPDGVLCGYRACEGDPIAFASRTADRLDAAASLLRDLGARRARFTLSRRDGPPITTALTLARGLDASMTAESLTALARGDLCGLELDAGCGGFCVAPSHRGDDAAHETTMYVERSAVPERLEDVALRALLDVVLDAHALQAWSAHAAEALRPRCVGRWERSLGVRALPFTAAWLGVTLREDVPRAFIDGAWREGDLRAYHPRAQLFRELVAPRGAAVGSPQVRALWRRTGGAPMQGGIA